MHWFFFCGMWVQFAVMSSIQSSSLVLAAISFASGFALARMAGRAVAGGSASALAGKSSRSKKRRAGRGSGSSSSDYSSDSDSDSDSDDDFTYAAAGSFGPYSSWSRGEPYKMVLCVRTDLGMAKGKIAAQAGHATLGVYKKVLRAAPGVLEHWEALGQTKIAVKVKSEEMMMELANHARALNVPHCVIRDAGRTQIAAGSKTVLAVGPAPESLVNKVTGHLTLL